MLMYRNSGVRRKLTLFVMNNNMMNEKRFNELYNRAYEKSYKVFSEFLNLDEQNMLADLYLPYSAFGGFDMAERIVAGFGEGIGKNDFPIKCLIISPVLQKFADKLTHRDFLGALMNLGIRREMLGDIIIADNCGYLFCLEQIAGYIQDNLTKIKHTSVKVSEADSLPENIVAEPEQTELIVSSLRLDAMVSAVYKLSRKDASRLFLSGKIFVNSRLTENCSYRIKENDIISVRGYGRFVFAQQIRKTKKERIVVSIKIYQ